MSCAASTPIAPTPTPTIPPPTAIPIPAITPQPIFASARSDLWAAHLSDYLTWYSSKLKGE